MALNPLPDYLSLCSLNCRGLGQVAKMQLLLTQLEKIRWDIVALQEVKRKDTVVETQPTGEVLYCFSTNSIHGTGFLVHPSLAAKIIGYFPVTSRISYLDVDCRTHTLRFISCYAPTTAASDAEYDDFLLDLNRIISSCARNIIPFVAGDLNAKMGNRKNQENAIGKYGPNTRNCRGQTLLDWLESNNYCSWNSFFKKRKPRVWTRSPNGLTYNQIDYFLSRPTISVMNVDVVNQFQYDSDHRLIRARIRLGKTKRKLTQPRKIRFVNRALFDFGMSMADDTDVTRFSSDQLYNHITLRLKTAHEVATSHVVPEPFLSPRTLDLMCRRRSLQSDITPAGRIQYTLASKAARFSRKEDVRRRREARLKHALDKGSSLKAVMNDGKGSRNMLVHLKDADGHLKHDSEAISGIVKKFFDKLYSTRTSTNIVDVDAAEPVPLFLESEILLSIRQTSAGTSPGIDNIPPEAMRWSSAVIAGDITTLFNDILSNGALPAEMMMSKTILLFKKEDDAKHQ